LQQKIIKEERYESHGLCKKAQDSTRRLLFRRDHLPVGAPEVEIPRKAQKESLETILKSEEELLHLITNLLDIARREENAMSIRPAPLDLHGLLEVWARKQSVVARKKGLNFVYDVSPGIRGGIFQADAFKVQQALNNLASNAFKFTPEDGIIKFRADIEADGRLFASIFNPGPAIPKEELSTIFDKYVRAEGAHENGRDGTGIGLDIARTIIELHGGRIWAESAEGIGNTFPFTLPPEAPIQDAKAAADAGALPCPA
jgi:signal transduction histidine kinase